MMQHAILGTTDISACVTTTDDELLSQKYVGHLLISIARFGLPDAEPVCMQVCVSLFQMAGLVDVEAKSQENGKRAWLTGTLGRNRPAVHVEATYTIVRPNYVKLEKLHLSLSS